MLQKFFVAAAQEVESIMDPETFYLSMNTTIQCSSSTENLERLELTSTGLEWNSPFVRSGCGFANNKWYGIDEIWNQNLITEQDCVTAAQSSPFIITLKPTVTEQLEGVDFWCFGTANRVHQETAHTTVNKIKSKSSRFTV